VTDVHHQRVDSKSEAVEYLAEVYDIAVDELEDDVCLAAKEDGPGVLLAWRGEQTRRLNLPRPPGLKIARHGWGRLDEQAVERLLAEATTLVTPVPALTASTDPVEAQEELTPHA
jgi:hypothetical protein